MLGVQLGALLDGEPSGVGAALDLVAGFDDVLVHGFARIGGERAAALAALAGALAATPLGTPAEEAIGKIVAGTVTYEHLAVLAGCRSALFGAVHDALLGRFDTALGRDRAAWREPTPYGDAVTGTDPATPGTAGDTTSDARDAAGAQGTAGGVGAQGTAGTVADAGPAGDAASGLSGGCRSWLQELAITGWRGVDHDLVSTAQQTVEALLADPGSRRMAVLLDGLTAELRASCPVATMERLPVRRWSDLWARALLLAQPGGLAAEPAERVSGRLLVLGVDVHEHATAVQVQVHAILEPAGGAPPRLVRTSVAAAKVDTIVGPAVWRLLHGHPVLLGALAEHRRVRVEDMPLAQGGDLVWHDERATAGEPADPFATARVLLPAATAPAVHPLDRHPVRIAEPVLVEGYRATGDAFELDGTALTVDLDRLPGCGPLTPELVTASSACIGLVRWDGGRWTLQPLAVRGTSRRKGFEAHNGDWAMGPTDPKVVKAEEKAGDAVAVLRERAGRLLRR